MLDISKIILKLLLITVLISIFYFSWIPDLSFRNIAFMPASLAFWADKHDNLRTAVPFIGLGVLLPILKEKSHLFYFFLFFVIVLLCEIGQLFMAKREFDLMDIFWGTLGGMIGVFLVKLFKTNLSRTKTIK